MKKRILSVLLAALMILSTLTILPITAAGEIAPDEGHDLIVTKKEIGGSVKATLGTDYEWDTTDPNKLIIKTYNLYVSGTTTKEYIEANERASTLMIDNLTINTPVEKAITFLNGYVTLYLKGNNTLGAYTGVGVSFADKGEICDEGSLSLAGANGSTAISAAGSLDLDLLGTLSADGGISCSDLTVGAGIEKVIVYGNDNDHGAIHADTLTLNVRLAMAGSTTYKAEDANITGETVFDSGKKCVTTGGSPAKSVLIVIPEAPQFYYGFDSSSKTLYLSATADAISAKSLTALPFNQFLRYVTTTEGSCCVYLPWSSNLGFIETVEILNDISPVNTDCWFCGMAALTEIKGLEHLDMSGVKSMHRMFCGCSALTSLDLSGLKPSNAKDMSHMFFDCDKLKSINFSGFDTSSVTSMERMFIDCDALESLDLSSFNTSNVTTMESMFEDCKALTSVNLSSFDTSNVTTMQSMFNSCESLTSVNLSSFDTSNVTNMLTMFDTCTKLSSVDLSSFDTSNVTDMAGMFYECRALTTLDLSNFNTSNVTGEYGFFEMFLNCESLTSVDLSSFDTSGIIEDDDGNDYGFAEMFSGCKSLLTLDLSNFDTSGVKSMYDMFFDCNALTALDISHFDTSNVTDMRSMFTGCSSLTKLDVSHFNTSNVTNMNSMFGRCSALTELDLSSFNTSNLTNMTRMFYNCEGLKELDLSGFDLTNVTSASLPFSGTKLTLIKTPKNLSKEARLPPISSSMAWYYADTLTAYEGNTLPTGKTESVTLVAGVLADSATALQNAINAASDDEAITVIFKQDLTTDTTITIPEGKNITLDLNGKVLNAGGGSFSVITVSEGSELTLIDSDPTAEHYFTVGDDGLWTLTDTKTETTKTVNGGVITGGNNNSGNGGGVYVDAGGSFTMKDGNIAGNTAYNGGGVYNSGTFTMTGGTISGNKAINSYGGGVYNNGTSTMTGGTISGNTAKNVGGVYIEMNKTLTLGGTAVISGNTNSKGKANDLFPFGTVTIGTGDEAPKTGMYIGLNSGKVTNAKASDVKYFFPNNKNAYIKFNDGDNSLTTDIIPSGSYVITVNSSNHGVVCAEQIMASGETVTVTVNPAEGFQLKSLKYNDGTTDYDITKDATTGEYQFTMPAANVTVTAVFAPELKAPQVPTVAAENVKAIMCDKYKSDLGWWPQGWGDCTWSEKTISGVNFRYAETMHWDCFAGDWQGAGVADYANLHFDIWFDEDGNAPIIKLEFNGSDPSAEITIPGTFKAGWNSVNINVEDTFGEQPMDDLKCLTVKVAKEDVPVAWANILFYNGTYTSIDPAEIDYAITDDTAQDANGTITVAATAKMDETVTVTVNPAEGYQLKELTVVDADGNPVTVTDNAFTMPAKNVTVTATFEKEIVIPPVTEVELTFKNLTRDDLAALPADLVSIKSITEGNDDMLGEVQNYYCFDKDEKFLFMYGQDRSGWAWADSTGSVLPAAPENLDDVVYVVANALCHCNYSERDDVFASVITVKVNGKELGVFPNQNDCAEGYRNFSNCLYVSVKYDLSAHSHNFVKQNAVEAGKDTAGCKEYYICSCGEAYEDEALTKKITDLNSWKAEGGAGYVAPTGGNDPEPTEPDDKGGANLTWLWILLGILGLLIVLYVVLFFIWKKDEKLPDALAFLGFLVPSYKAINSALFKKEEKKEE